MFSRGARVSTPLGPGTVVYSRQQEDRHPAAQYWSYQNCFNWLQQAGFAPVPGCSHFLRGTETGRIEAGPGQGDNFFVTITSVAVYSVCLDNRKAASEQPPFPSYTGTLLTAEQVQAEKKDLTD